MVSLSRCLVLYVVALWTLIPIRAQLTVNEKQLKAIEQYMDVTEDPCDDFFSYSCGKWGEQHKSGRYSESTGLVDHKINKRLVNLLQVYRFGQDSIKDKVFSYYLSCRRERKRQISHYLKIVKPGKYINWPLLQHNKGNTKSWPQKEFDWLKTVANLRRYGLKNALLEHLVLQNLTDSMHFIIDLDKPTLDGNSELPDLNTMLIVLESLGLGLVKGTKLSRRLMSFEQEVKKLLEMEDEYGVLLPSIQDVQDDLPNWSWQQYFEIILGHRVTEDYTFQIRNFPYFIGLAELLDKTEPELICNYLMFKFLYYLGLDSSSSADKIDCMVDVRSKMDLATNFIYAERFHKKEADDYNNDVRKIIEVIRAEFRKKLEENRVGLSTDELDYLRKKLNEMDVVMGNLPKHINHEFVEQYYEDIELDRKNYYRNHLTLLKLRFLKEHEALFKGKPQFDDFFYIADSDTARSSTPFYLVRQNLIVVPYGFLQTPIYHHNMHDVLKYSLLGFNLAHEIAHGFDASGVLYNFQGDVDDIGSNITENSRFSDALLCMQRDETTSLDERVADIVGIRLAYDAFFKNNDSLVQTNSEFKGKSLREIFFLNFAQFFCGNMAFEFMDHDSDNVRLQETLLNFEFFAETYQCDLGATMHPEKKCRLW